MINLGVIRSPCPTQIAIPSNKPPQTATEEIKLIMEGGNPPPGVSIVPYTENVKAMRPGEYHFWVSLRVTNVANQGWIELSNNMTVTILTEDINDSNIYAIQHGQCGMSGVKREFSPVNLNSEYKKYETNIKNLDADYFSLQPGEFEYFDLGLQCDAPGKYKPHISIPFMYEGNRAMIEVDLEVTYVCPFQYSVTRSDDANNDNGFQLGEEIEYIFTNGDYEIKR